MVRGWTSAHARFLALAALALAIACGAAQAADGPPAGRYEIRTGFAPPTKDNPKGYDVLSYIILRADGSYELYYTEKNELRGRGTYTFEPGNAGAQGSVGIVRWKSGINYEMGRGGSYFPRNAQYGCNHCFVLGRNVVAVLTP